VVCVLTARQYLCVHVASSVVMVTVLCCSIVSADNGVCRSYSNIAPLGELVAT
jgi:hypothetical protein